MLEEYGLTEEQVTAIIDGHAKTVNGLQEEIAKYKEYVGKYETLKAESEKYKDGVAKKELQRQKSDAVRAYYESKGITGKNLEIAMKASHAEIDAAELDGDKIKDCTAFDALVSGDYACLVSKTVVRGADTPTPVQRSKDCGMTKKEICGIKDTVERQKAWANYLRSSG